MNAELQNLTGLQQADSEIARLRAEVAALPKRIAEIETKLAGARKQMEEARAAVKADEANRRKYEVEIKALQQKVSKYRDQMLEVKTNEQYKALTHEVGFAEDGIRVFEDKILETMVDADEKEAIVKAAEAELRAQTAIIEKEKADAKQRTEEDEKLLAEWAAKRDQLRAGVTPDTLRHYDRVLHLRGSALAEARDHKCSVCQVMLRPQVWNDVRLGETVVSCDSCQRILYVDPNRPVEAEPASPSQLARARVKAGGERGWHYLRHHPEYGEIFLAFTTAKGSSRVRIYDAHTGRKVHETGTKDVDLKAVLGEALPLKAKVHLQALNDWGNELPVGVLDELHSELKHVVAEAGEAAG